MSLRLEKILTAEARVELQFSVGLGIDPAKALAQVRIPGLPIFAAARGDRPERLILATGDLAPRPYEVAMPGLTDGSGNALAPLGAERFFKGPPRPAIESHPNGLAPASIEALKAAGWTWGDAPDATNSKPSSWGLADGWITQSSNIYGGTAHRSDVNRPGTYFIARAEVAPDSLVEALFETADDDGLGLVARYRDPANHYRFDLDRNRRRRWITRVAGGVSTLLAVDSGIYDRGRPFNLRFVARGDRLEAYYADQMILCARDQVLKVGTCGLFCWAVNSFKARDILICPVAPELPVSPAPAQRPSPDAPYASHGVLASDPSPSSIWLWTRSETAARVSFEVSADPLFKDARVSPPQETRARDDFIASREIDELQPETRYYYRPLMTSEADPRRRSSGPIATFVTPPLPEAPRALTLMWSADLHTNLSEGTFMLDVAGAEPAELFLCLGDFPYATTWPAAQHLSEFRQAHKVLRSCPTLSRFLTKFAVTASWNDGEVVIDWDGFSHPRPVASGIRAWREYFPCRVPAGRREIYRSLRWGQHLEVFLLDVRSARSPSQARDGPGKTLLGDAQKSWLFQELVRSTATYKAIATVVPLRFAKNPEESWEAYTHERAELFSFLKKNELKNVFFITGDCHWAAVHRHPEGFTEVMACPLTAAPNDPPKPDDPAILYRAKTYAYGLIVIDAEGRECRVDIKGPKGETIRTERFTNNQ